MPEPAAAAKPTRQDLKPSPKLSIIKNGPKSFAGRKVGALVTDGVDAGVLAALEKALKAEGAMLKLVAPEVGGVKDSAGALARRRREARGRSVRPVRRRRDTSLQGGGNAADHAPSARDFVADAAAHRKFIAYCSRGRSAAGEGGRRARRGLRPPQRGRRLRRVRRRLPQAPLLGPRRRRAVSPRIGVGGRGPRAPGLASMIRPRAVGTPVLRTRFNDDALQPKILLWCVPEWVVSRPIRAPLIPPLRPAPRAATRARSSAMRMAQEGFEPSASLGLNESGLPVAYRASERRLHDLIASSEGVPRVGLEPTRARV